MDADQPPARPQRFTERELRFAPQPAVRWFSPGVLTATGLHVGVVSVFGSFLDKRELQAAKPCDADVRYADREELWVDYVADTGDGFEATATVATRVAKRELVVPGVDRPLPRGQVLVLGGDEVYPSASADGYENRLEGPWRAALPWTERDHPTVFAIAGNHDWTDGLTGFLRLFGQNRWLGGWRSHQTRSYFAAQLPHHWWLWGIDIQSETLIDEPQLEFFGRVAQQAEPGDKLILATAVPSWTQIRHDPAAYRNLAYLERTILQPHGLRLKLTVAGDTHHYSRYQHEGAEEEIGPAHKITAGGGGAFLHPTHVLPDDAEIGVNPDDPAAVARYEMRSAYPSRARSRWLSWRALLLAWRNPSFMVVPGIVTLAALWTVQFGLRSLERRGGSFAEAGAHWGWTDLAGGLFRTSISAVTLLVLFGGLFAFAEAPQWASSGGARLTAKAVMALIHLGLQVVAIATVLLVALRAASGQDDWRYAVVASVVAFCLGGPVGATVVGLYLALALATPGLGAHPNEAFAAARITGWKNFLRIHIDRDGVLTVYAIGIDRSVKRRHWRAVPAADDPEAAWIAPAPAHREPPVRLIESITLR